LACHNPQTIPLHASRAIDSTVAQLADRLRRALPYVTGVTISGGEATIHAEFIHEFFTYVKTNPDLKELTTFVDSNGNASREVWDLLAPVTDGFMLDLKVLDNKKHIFLTGESNSRVIESIKHLCAIGKLYEVRLLLVPGQNDSQEDLSATGQLLMDIDTQMRVKVNAFKNHGVRASATAWREVTDTDLARYREVLSKSGVTHLVFGVIEQELTKRR